MPLSTPFICQSPTSSKKCRRLSRGSREKTVISMIQGKYSETRVPRFLKRAMEEKKGLNPCKSISIWKKSVALQKYKLIKYLESIKYLKNILRSLKTDHISKCLNNDNSSSGILDDDKPMKYSATKIINTLLDEGQDDSPADIPSSIRERSFHQANIEVQRDARRTSRLAELLKQNSGSLNFTTTDYPKVKNASPPMSPNSNKKDPERETFTRSRRRGHLEHILEEDEVPPLPNKQHANELLKFPSIRVESKDPLDSFVPSLFTRKRTAQAESIDESIMSEEAGNLKEGRRRGRPIDISPLSQDIMDTAQATYRMSLVADVEKTESTLQKPQATNKHLLIHQIRLIEDTDDPEVERPRGRALGTIQELLRQERDPSCQRKDSTCSIMIGYESKLEKNIKKFDDFVTRSKGRMKETAGLNKNDTGKYYGSTNDRLTMSDTEADHKKNIREKYNDNHETVGVKDFYFLAQLGKGGFGSVWLVKRIATSDLYALKVIKFNNSDPRLIETMVNENKILMSLVGDYVVKGIFSFVHDRYYCVVMDLMVGGDFRKLLDENEAFYEDDAKFYAAELINAVSHIHSQGITHRDLKPENMLLDNKGHLKLADFGLSNQAELTEQSEECIYKVNLDVSIVKRRKDTRFYEKDSRKPLVSGKASGRMLVGTPDYMAPEMINSIDDNGQSIDWWAIGCIIYELIVGIPPFNASTKEEVWDNIRNRRLEWPPIGYGADCMTPEAQDLIDQLLQLDPANRLTDLDLIKKHAFFKDIDWQSILGTQPPMVPKLNSLAYDKDSLVQPSQIFGTAHADISNSAKLAHKYKRQNIQGVRHDVLHEENLNHVLDIAERLKFLVSRKDKAETMIKKASTKGLSLCHKLAA